MSPADIVKRLEGVHQNGGGWIARCPAHEDGTASLSIGTAEDGRALLHCHAGCATEAVLSAMKLTMADLFLKSRPAARNIVTTYDYTDEKGGLLYQVVRFEPKDFRQRRPDGVDGWTWNTRGVRRVLYRLPKVISTAQAGGVLFVVEGEKDVDALEGIGLTATCNPGGASQDDKRSKWRDEFSGHLKGAGLVAILPDNDDPGRAHAQAVTRSVARTGGVTKVIELPGLPPKGDVSDWLAAGGTKVQLEELVEAAPVWRLVPLRFVPKVVDGCHQKHQEQGGGGGAIVPAVDGAADIDRLRAEAATALSHPRPLELFEESCRGMGLGGNLALATTVFLAATTRVIAREKRLQAHTYVLGPASSGKSYEMDAALEHLPPGAVVRFDGASPRALIYSDDDIQHRALVYSEMDSIPAGNGDEGDAASTALSYLRTLVVNGRATYDVTVKTKDGYTTRRYCKEGPATLLVTGTRRLGDDQLASRLHEVEVTVDRARLRAVIDAQGRLLGGGVVAGPSAAIIAMQAYLQALAPIQVTLPFAGALGRAILVKAKLTDPRLTREFPRVAGFTAAHALLCIERRERAADGAVVATLEDYETARSVIRELSTVREFSKFAIEVWVAVDTIFRETTKAVTVGQVSKVMLKDHNHVRKTFNALLQGGAFVDARDSRKTAPHLVTPSGESPCRILLPTVEELGYHSPDTLPKRGQVEAAQGANLGTEAPHLGTEASALSRQELTPLRQDSPQGIPSAGPAPFDASLCPDCGQDSRGCTCAVPFLSLADLGAVEIPADVYVDNEGRGYRPGDVLPDGRKVLEVHNGAPILSRRPRVQP